MCCRQSIQLLLELPAADERAALGGCCHHSLAAPRLLAPASCRSRTKIHQHAVLVRPHRAPQSLPHAPLSVQPGEMQLQHSRQCGQQAGSSRASRPRVVRVAAAAHVAGIREEAVERGGPRGLLLARPFRRRAPRRAAGLPVPLMERPRVQWDPRRHRCAAQAAAARRSRSMPSLCPSRMCSRTACRARSTRWTRCSTAARTAACWTCTTTWTR